MSVWVWVKSDPPAPPGHVWQHERHTRMEPPLAAGRAGLRGGAFATLLHRLAQRVAQDLPLAFQQLTLEWTMYVNRGERRVFGRRGRFTDCWLRGGARCRPSSGRARLCLGAPRAACRTARGTSSPRRWAARGTRASPSTPWRPPLRLRLSAIVHTRNI